MLLSPRGLCITIHAWVLQERLRRALKSSKKLFEKRIFSVFILIGCEKTISYFFFNNSFEIDCFYIKCDLFQRNRDEKKFFLFFLFFSFYFGIERNLIGRSVLKFSTWFLISVFSFSFFLFARSIQSWLVNCSVPYFYEGEERNDHFGGAGDFN